jgi:hypothetical protein
VNAISNPTHASEIAQSSLSSGSTSEPESFTLRRTGRKAIRFQGRQLVEAIGGGHDHNVAHDLNIYETTSGRIIVELIVRRSLPESKDLHRIHKFDDLPSAASWLEAYCAGEDVTIPSEIGNAETTLPWAVLYAVSLRQTMARIECEYRGMLSDVFMALDLTDPADTVPTTPLGRYTAEMAEPASMR